MTSSLQECSSSGSSTPEEPSKELLEDICAKFILFSPKDSLNREKLFFLVEQAWWHYEDRIRPGSSTNLKHYSSYTTFAEPLFRKCEALSHLRPNLQAYLEDYRKYKQSIPVYGAILLDAAMEQVLLVRGNKSSMGWGFPRGKVNEGESEPDCAIREVLEETGYDIRSQLDENEFLEVTTDGKRHKLYIVAGLDPETQEFEPHSKWEIGAYAWHRVDALPATSDEASQVYMSADGVRHRFFMIHPFVGRLRKWIDKRRRQSNGRALSQHQHQPGRAASGTWSVTSSTASSMQLPLRDLQQAMASQGPATPAATAAAAAAAAAVAAISGPAATYPAQAPPPPTPQPPSQGRKEHRGSRMAQGQPASASGVTPERRQQQQQAPAHSFLHQVQQRLDKQLAVEAGGKMTAMANFRFDRGSILNCFAAVA